MSSLRHVKRLHERFLARDLEALDLLGDVARWRLCWSDGCGSKRRSPSGRAMTLQQEFVQRSFCGTGQRRLALVDNFATALSLEKKQTHSLDLFQLCRRGAIELATIISFVGAGYHPSGILLIDRHTVSNVLELPCSKDTCRLVAVRFEDCPPQSPSGARCRNVCPKCLSSVEHQRSAQSPPDMDCWSTLRDG